MPVKSKTSNEGMLDLSSLRIKTTKSDLDDLIPILVLRVKQCSEEAFKPTRIAASFNDKGSIIVLLSDDEFVRL
jgi:hypothetical protein